MIKTDARYFTERRFLYCSSVSDANAGNAENASADFRIGKRRSSAQISAGRNGGRHTLKHSVGKAILKSKAIGGFLFEVLELSQPPAEFDTKLWIISIENVTVHSDGRMIFKFKNGTEIEI